MIKGLESHQYAPELNKLHLRNGAMIPAPGATTIRDARKALFKPLARKGHHVTIAKTYESAADQWLNDTISGMVDKPSDALDVLNSWRAKAKPGAQFKTTIKLIG